MALNGFVSFVVLGSVGRLGLSLPVFSVVDLWKVSQSHARPGVWLGVASYIAWESDRHWTATTAYPICRVDRMYTVYSVLGDAMLPLRKGGLGPRIPTIPGLGLGD